MPHQKSWQRERARDWRKNAGHQETNEACNPKKCPVIAALILAAASETVVVWGKIKMKMKVKFQFLFRSWQRNKPINSVSDELLH